ncbi:hypothetical protein, partial [Mycobacterium alsense]
SAYSPGAPQGPGGPPQPPPPQWSPPGAQAPGGGAPMPQDGLAAVKDVAGKVSVTGWIVLGGLVVTVIAIFLPFATVSFKLFGETLGSHDVSANGAAKIVVVVLAALAGWLAYPALTGTQMAVARLIAVSVVVGLLGALTFVWFNTVSSENDKGEGIVDLTPGFGLMLYALAVVVTAVGVVRLWIDRSKAQKRSY